MGDDLRIGKRINTVLERMMQHGSSVINRFKDDYAARRGTYRVLNNTKWNMEDLLSPIYTSCGTNCAGISHVLCLQDTTELNYDNLRGRIDDDDPDFGYGTGKGSDNCLFAHASLVVDADNGLPLGYSYMKIWGRGNRSRRKPDERKRLTMESKESYRWAESAVSSSRVIPSGVCKTVVGDRESDIYEVMCRIVASGCDFLIRSSSNRLTDVDGRRLSEVLTGMEAVCSYELPIDNRKGRKNRTAIMDLRFCRVRIQAPVRCSDGLPGELEVWCVHAVERAESVPQGESPVEWRLLTSHSVETVTDAMRCIFWYRKRWLIEELFRTVKSKGFDVGSAQLERGCAMKKLIALTLIAAQRVMAIKIAYDNGLEDMPASIVFTKEQIAVLWAVLPKYEPKSKRYTKGRNHHKPESLPWAAWIVASMGGGWSGTDEGRKKFGYIKVLEGLKDLEKMAWMMKMIRENVCRE